MIAGIVAEFNPFHNGHLYQLNTLHRQLKPDLVIVVMSGDFLQRGEPAVVSKWTRTRMALKAGVDLVVELPYLFAVGRADIFARGAIAILDRLGVNQLFFGSECGRIEPFRNSLKLMHDQKKDYNAHLIELMNRGISYPNAHAAAYRFIAQNHSEDLVDLTQPNNNLGFHYMHAIQSRGSNMAAATLKRTQAGHNDRHIDPLTSIASASAIRRHLLNECSLQAVSNKMPDYVADLLRAHKQSAVFADWEHFFPFLKYKLLASSETELALIYEMEEGIEHRLQRCIRSAETFDAFMSAVKTKRYTRTRLQRLAVHVLTGMIKQQAKPLALYGEPDEVRLLGMNGRGQDYLASIRKEAKISIISKVRNHRSALLDCDIKAAQIYDYLLRPKGGAHTTETGQPPLRFDERNNCFSGE